MPNVKMRGSSLRPLLPTPDAGCAMLLPLLCHSLVGTAVPLDCSRLLPLLLGCCRESAWLC